MNRRCGELTVKLFWIFNCVEGWCTQLPCCSRSTVSHVADNSLGFQASHLVFFLSLWLLQFLLLVLPSLPSFFFFFLIDLYRSIIASQYCVSFCCRTKWISHVHTHVPVSPPSWASLPSSVSHPSRSLQSTEPISLCYAAASHQPTILHSVVYICWCYSHFAPVSFALLPHVLKCIFYVYLFIPALQLGSSVPFFFRFHIYALAYGICFSLSDLLHSVWQTLSPSTSLQITQFCFFLWLSNIPLYICATSSLSIHLSMDI